MKHRILILPAFLLMLAAAAAPTTLVRMSLEQLVAVASAVVRARCLERSSRWENAAVWTFTEFEVLEGLKGSPPHRLSVRLIGGRAAGVATRVDAVPQFQPGEEVILFLEPSVDGSFTVTAWAEGTFRVRRDPLRLTARVTQDTAGLVVFDPLARQFSPSGIRDLPLEEFRRRVADAVRRAGKREAP